MYINVEILIIRISNSFDSNEALIVLFCKFKVFLTYLLVPLVFSVLNTGLDTELISQYAHNVILTSIRRRFNVMDVV